MYDAVVAALTGDGFAVILNNHTNTSRWCCGIDGNERWNSAQSTQQWADDWVFMARRYAGDPGVVGADLYNEVRRDVLDDPNWGQGDAHDWYAAAQLAADRILTEADPDLLIVIEGINWTGLPVDGLPHGRPTLAPARTLSHTLVAAHKLVYSAHFYGYTGPSHSGATGIGETHDARYQDLTRDQLFQTLDDQALFVEQGNQHFTAPVWVSEFGIGAGRPARPPAPGSATSPTTSPTATPISPTGRSSGGKDTTTGPCCATTPRATATASSTGPTGAPPRGTGS